MNYTVFSTAVEGGSLLDCTDCGPLGFYGTAERGRVIYDHLKEHGCNMDTVDIRPIESN